MVRRDVKINSMMSAGKDICGKNCNSEVFLDTTTVPDVGPFLTSLV